MGKVFNLPLLRKEDVDVRKFHRQRARSAFRQRNPWLSRDSEFDVSAGVYVPGRRLREKLLDILNTGLDPPEDRFPYEHIKMIGFMEIQDGSFEEMLEFRFTHENGRGFVTVSIHERDGQDKIDELSLRVGQSQSVELWDYGKSASVRLVAVERSSVVLFVTIIE